MVDGDRIAQTWDEDPDTLVRYAMDDVRETARLSTLLSPPSFHLTQMVPCSYGTVTRIGSAARIELLLVREYLRQKHSLPQPVPRARRPEADTRTCSSPVCSARSSMPMWSRSILR